MAPHAHCPAVPDGDTPPLRLLERPAARRRVRSPVAPAPAAPWDRWCERQMDRLAAWADLHAHAHRLGSWLGHR